MPVPPLAHATPRGFEELRGVLIELVEEGSALGLTAAELFLQFGDRACTDGIGSRQLQEGLASLSVHLTGAEVETLLVGAGCPGENEQNPKGGQLLSLEQFSAMVEKPPVPPPAVADTESTAAVPSDALDMPQPPSSAEVGEGTPLNRDDDNSSRRAAEDDDVCVTPDSLAPRMSLSELLVDVREVGGSGDGDGPGTSSSAAAHVEAFGRVAANVQAVLATAISGSGTGHDGSGSGGFGRHEQPPPPNISDSRNQRSSTDASNAKSSRTPASTPMSASRSHVGAARAGAGAAAAAAERTSDEDEEKKYRTEPEDSVAQTPPSSRVSTYPRTGAITPPLGSARSPSEPLHPTRASRERLEAALEGLDLKERLRPTTSVGGNGQGGSGDGGGGGSVSGSRRSHRSAGGRLPGRGGLSRRLASVDVGGGGTGVSGSGRRGSAIRARIVAGVDERGARVHRLSGRASGRGGAGAEQRRRLGEVVDLAAAEHGDFAAYDGGLEEAPEVIGRLRAKVAELELSEQLLRCELEGARADLVSKSRRAEEDVQREVTSAKDRERTLQAKMGARLRAAEAEAAAAEKRMAEFKRTSAAEAAAREKSSAEYLRRRLKETEATLEAKTARRASLLSKQHQHQHQHNQALSASRRRPGRRRESWGEENGTDSPGGSASGGGVGVDGGRGTSGRWARPRARRRTEATGEVLPGGVDADGHGDKSEAAVMVRLREELASCRKKLAEATAETSRLRKEARCAERAEKGDGRRDTRRRAEMNHGAGDTVGGGGGERAGQAKLALFAGNAVEAAVRDRESGSAGSRPGSQKAKKRASRWRRKREGCKLFWTR